MTLRLPRKAYVGLLVVLLGIYIGLMLFHEGTKVAVNASLEHAKNQINSYRNGGNDDTNNIAEIADVDNASETPVNDVPETHSEVEPVHEQRLSVPNAPDDLRLENATLYTLCRNQDLSQMLVAVRSVERNFNKKYHYDWVFLNDEEFTDRFKEAIMARASGNVYFGKLDAEAWGYPDFIDLDRAAETRQWMLDHNVVYGNLESYHHMCRFQSGYFFRHPLMMRYRYAWRVEPGIKILCKQKSDPFELMRTNEMVYGFNIAPHDIADSVTTLWDSVKKFLASGGDKYVVNHNLAAFISNDNLETYNLCHFWTNFEISDMDWLRSEAYMNFFEFLDHEGGFYYERWGDAPVRSIAVSLFLPQEKVHFFNEIGYFHSPFGHCPYNQAALELECSCKARDNVFNSNLYDYHKNSCLRDYFKAKGRYYHEENPNMEDSF